MKFIVKQQPAYAYTGGKTLAPSQPSVVFIHGAANDHSVWALQSRHFAYHGWNALAVDLPGHGKSFGKACTSIDQYADWVIDLLDHGGLQRAALVGHSMGSLIALQIAMRHPDRVSHLALLGTSLPMPVGAPLMEAALQRPHEAYDMLTLWGHAPPSRLGASPIPGTSLLMAYRCLLEKSRPGVLANDLAACQAFNLPAADLATITIPTLILNGSRDLMTPAKAATALASRIASSRLVILDDVGHNLMQEAPVAVLDALKKFLA
ncbi:MAG: alpha/beta hydrolase [Betaproteobacteria bacterium]|nr:alpha/beta hydrolase [Betaproteobacteria bacterium]